MAALDYGIKRNVARRLAARGVTTHVLPSSSTMDDVRGGRAGRGVPVARPGRPGHRRRRGRAGPRGDAARDPAVRHLLRQPDPRSGPRLRYLQARLRAPRASTSRCWTGPPARSRSPRTTTVSPSARHWTSVVDTDFGRVEVSHVCLNDDVVEGLRCRDVPAFTVQYHPEAAAGPHDADYLFDRFVELIGARARMPRRTDLQHILVIGSGPDRHRAGLRVRLLRHPGLPGTAGRGAAGVSLVNSNPATIMTDPEFADATYVEPITPEFVEKVIARERPDALLATLGGQTALNTAVALHEVGVLDKYGVELIGAEHRRDPARRGPAAVQGDRGPGRRRLCPARGSATRWRRYAPSCRRAGPAGGDPAVVHHGWPRLGHGRTTTPTWTGSPAPGWPRRRCTRCSSRRACSAGRSTSSS